MSLEAWGDENPYDGGDYEERLINAGWLSADEAKMISDAARVWIAARTARQQSDSYPTPEPLQKTEREAECSMLAALIVVFGEDYLTPAASTEEEKHG